jgi:hypothetical protein
MQFLMISRRDGEAIPINPAQVTFLRRVGEVTQVTMADGQTFRIRAGVDAVLKAIEQAADASPSGKRHTIEIDEPPPPGATVAPAGAPPAAEAEPAEDEGGKEAKVAHDDGEAAHRGSRR